MRGKARGEAHIRMPGVHYAQNALAALALADFFGISFEDYREAMAGLDGVDRRFSVRGEAGGVLVVDDYGHHPTEIAATAGRRAPVRPPGGGRRSSPTATAAPGTCWTASPPRWPAPTWWC